MASVVLPRSTVRRLMAAPANQRGAAIFGDDVGDAVSKILSSTFPKIYGDNWLKQLQPLTLQNVRDIVRGAMYYYSLGYSTKDLSFRQALQKSFPKIAPLNITKVLSFITGIDPARFPADIALLKTGKRDQAAESAQSDISSQERKEYIAQEIQDKIRRGTGAVASAAFDAAKTIDSALPWYFKPRVILPAAAGVALLYFWAQKKLASKILRPAYRSNPVKRTAAEKEQAEKLYRKFHEFGPKKTRKIPKIETGELVDLGQALEIGYRSRKWTGKPENYLHKFSKGVRLMSSADGKTLIINGGDMEVRAEGITN